MPTLTRPDGIELQLFDWPPPADPVRGAVVLVHGLGEHAQRYAHVVDHLRACGWACHGYDQRGHGRSGGPRGAIPADDSLLADLGAVIDRTRGRHPGPLVLLGHSLGGLLVGRYVAEGLQAQPADWWQPVDALAMSSPALDPGMNAAQKLLLAVLGPLAPSLAVGNGLKPAWISRDDAVVAAYQADPLVHDRVTPRLVRFIVEAGERVRASAPRWVVPTLLQYAGADRCVAPRGSAAFAAAAPASVVQVREYAGLFHEIFNEPEQAQVLADLATWLARRAH